METNKGTTTIEDLSDDLTLKILSLLPFKTIVLCLGACKRWQSLISNGPFFLTDTINIAYVPSHNLYFCLQSGQNRRMNKPGFCLSVRGWFARIPDTLKSDYKYEHRILASCNGLLFSGVISAVTGDLHECYIFNPWTREHITLQKPSNLTQTSVCGLAFENNPINSYSYSRNSSTTTNNNVAVFKIVVVHEIKKFTYRFEVYSSKKKRWQLLESAFKSVFLRRHEVDDCGVYCNRVLYWQCCDNRALTFNVETETPGHLDLPSDHDEASASDYKRRSRVTECHGQLHCIRINSTGHRLSIWKMMTTASDGWLILYNVDLAGAAERNLDILDPNRWFDGRVPNLKPIDMYCQGDDKVLLDHNGYGVISYDMKRDVFELLRRRGLYRHFTFFRYTPTNRPLSKRSKRSKRIIWREGDTALPSRKRSRRATTLGNKN